MEMKKLRSAPGAARAVSISSTARTFQKAKTGALPAGALHVAGSWSSGLHREPRRTALKRLARTSPELERVPSLLSATDT